MTTANRPRVEPVAPPYPTELQAVFDRIMPPAVPPLTLFTTLARAGGGVQRRADVRADRAGRLLPHRVVLRERPRACAGALRRAAAVGLTEGGGVRVGSVSGRRGSREDSATRRDG